ncbi:MULTISPECIES: hypothetical protein [unclassified Micromonospora]|uniref:hypothetical protein n=1 Tax=unclassified Micromonospora TaxID=2617518 RepID=UPI0018906288|nr:MULTISPECIES: hypothetical protein [unclassified Micromonospora]MBF5032435.1 hypothetical protein [Micromonospora sp. ANENR4]MCZ7478627.1 hypothetical protein [Micromonospora sp. WMMC273]WBC03310.1 hypothetical protein O7546_30220 [Micromonospora sp. WMMA1976]
MTKKLIIGPAEWFIADADASGVVRLVREAMTNRTTVELGLYDGAGRAVTVFLNGATAASVVLALDPTPRPPSEMS